MKSLEPISNQIWDLKYRLKDSDGTPSDRTVSDTWRRVAAALSEAEPEAAFWRERFYGVMEDFRFLPAGRIVAGAGTDRNVTLFNCFVMGTIPDDLSGIFDALREAAVTMQQGGGIGYDFSTLRPNGALVHGVAADASGPLSFMDVWDSMCRTIMSAGSRRGAMMATLRCDHPDIAAFIAAKKDAARLRMFNLSVLVTDSFMRAVDADEPWDLVFDGTVYRTVQALDLWDQIMQATYDTAEPGVIFIDRINQRNNLAYCETIAATNPCGEQPLPPYGACLLGSINLARLVTHPFEAEAALDLDVLQALVPVAVRMLDNVIDISQFPLPEQHNEALTKRRIGLGVTGLADALIMCGVRYGSAEAVRLVEAWMRQLRDTAYRASVDLAREKGAFPLFDPDRYLAGEVVAELPEDIRAGIQSDGIRNALLTSIAPTGTISLLADNVSSGLEPVFAFNYDRTVLASDGTRHREPVSDYAYRLFRRTYGEAAPLSDAFVDAQTLRPEDHVVMQAAVQKYVDSAISKTINCPEGIEFTAFKDVYRAAYEAGCKGCTTYRPNPVTGAILTVKPESSDRAATPRRGDGNVVQMAEPLDRPGSLSGHTYKTKWPESDHAIYITLNDIVQDGRCRPFEIFINSKNMEHYAWTVALTRMISAVFRRGGDVSFVVEELKAVFDPRGGAWMNQRYVPSLLAAIGEVIERHMVAIGFLKDPNTLEMTFEAGFPKAAAAAGPGQCPQCGSAGVLQQEGCDLCTACGYSKCG